MFGNAPKAVWERYIAPDEFNRIPLACRCFLIRDGNRLVLLESGIGAFFAPALRDRFGVVESHHVLLDSLAAVGVSPSDIDVIVLSHLHFDHAGGLLTPWSEAAPLSLVFPNATYVVSRLAFERAQMPHPRDRASFIPELLPLLLATNRLVLIDDGATTCDLLGPGYRFHHSQGHTPGLLLTEVELVDGPALFAADLIPGKPWVHLPITMGYDRFPELLINEKTTILTDLLARGGRLLFTHDAATAMGTIVRDERGRFGTADNLATIA